MMVLEKTQRSLETEILISGVKETFQKKLIQKLKLTKVNPPLFLSTESGLNDNLNGVERPVSFVLKDTEHQIVHSLAKWKRWYLGKLKAKIGQGIVTNMIAIRADEELSDIHSYLVDQWDWEKVIQKEDRTITTLFAHGTAVYEALKETEKLICKDIERHPSLPEKLTIIHSEELLQKYPTQTPKEREHLIAEEFGAILLIGVGGKLSDGTVHDLRAPDYDDWTTKDEFGRPGLNADLIIWNPTTKKSIEISSMGVRVDETTMLQQLKERKVLERTSLPFHAAILKGKLPYTIGGGIGQSRVVMFITGQEKIADVQPIIDL